ncbi:MAG: ubiquinol oxidase subunit II [Betaproteobacteria bacterium]|nr:ubiquinol oxidase subunit II [Betaproteobacteria bacterium]MDE1989133.1 ubiquinol oxidase subunit II [Betaproteobacteria bacterium]
MLSLWPQWVLACDGDCGSRWALLDPKGPIAAHEKGLIITAFALMLLVVIPVIFMTVAFAWKYRASNKKAQYAPNWDNSHKIEAVVWAVPAVIVAILAALVWKSSHELNPYRPIQSAAKPVQVQVVSMNWKWLFIYPELGIASVNRLVIPAGVPVSFKITSDAVMSSFFIPQLGGQIYAMAGMQTRLQLVADQPGSYQGLNTQFNGDGFAGMHFETVAASSQDFESWVAQVKHGATPLNETTFKALEIPSENVSPRYFSSVEPQLFERILQKYLPNAEAGQTGRHGMTPAM